MSQKFRNLTPHPLVILDQECASYDHSTRGFNLVGDKKVLCEIPPEGGDLPRVDTVIKPLREEEGIPLVSLEFGEIVNLPEREEGVYLITSAIAAQAAAKQGRDDVLCPAQMVRDESGNIVGCLALARQ